MKSNCVFRKAIVLLLSLMLVTAFFPACLGIPASADSLPKIWLDAGHGGNDPGATNGDRHEADDNLRITLAVGAKLEKIGFPVGYSRTTDVAVDLGDRVPMGGRVGVPSISSASIVTRPERLPPVLKIIIISRNRPTQRHINLPPHSRKKPLPQPAG